MQIEQVPTAAARPHPNNPRQGNVAAIADSLRVNGQYKPILIQRSTGHILAGNHTWRAARKLGWTTIAATYTDADDTEALQILLADNRAADAGWTDQTAVFQILATLPNLDGTGYTPEDLTLPDLPDDDWTNPTEPADTSEALEDQEPAPAPEAATERFDIGRAKGTITTDAYKQWRTTLPKSNGAAAEEILTRLGLNHPRAQGPARTVTAGEQVPIRDLIPHPENPHQGDIGMLVNLLRHHGQNRPVVANKRTRHILAGNHITAAAAQLGWPTVWVAWVDTDDAGEKRILVADNRTSELASYDMDALGRSVAALGAESIAATGFTLDDLNDIIAGRPLQETARTAGVWIAIGKLKAKVTAAALAGLNLTPGQEHLEAAFMLGIAPDQVATS